MPGRDAPRRRSARRVLAVLGLLLIAVLVAAVLFREALARRAAISWLEDQGVSVQSLDVTGLTPGGLQARAIALGADNEVTAQRFDIALAWDGLQPRVTRAEVTGLRLTLDITGEQPLLGSLQPALDRLTAGSADTTAAPPEQAGLPLPPVSLVDALVTFRTPSGPMTADLDGSVSPDEAGGMTAEATLDLDSDLGRLHAGITARQNAAGGLSLTADLSEGRLAWQGFAVGRFAGSLEVTQDSDGPPRLAADFDLGQLAYTPADGSLLTLDSGKLTATGTPRQAEASISLEGAEERLSFHITAHQDGASEGATAGLTLDGELQTAGGFGQFLPVPGPKVTAGTIVLQAEGSGRPAGDLTDADAWRDLPSLLAESRLQLRGDAILGEIALADGTTGISAHLPLAGDLADNRLTLTLREDAAVRVEQPSRDSLRALGVPDDLRPLVASGLNLTLAAGGDLPLRIAATPAWPPEAMEVAVAATAHSGQGLMLTADIDGAGALGTALTLERFEGRITAGAEAPRLSLGGREARGVALTLPLTADYAKDGLSLALNAPGALRIQQFGRGAPLHLQSPLSFAIDTLALESLPDVAGYRYRLHGSEDGAAFTIAAAERQPLEVAVGALTLRIDGQFAPDSGHDTAVALRLDDFELPAQRFAAQSAEIDIDLDRELRPATSRFTVGPFQVGDDAPVMAPMSLSGKLARQGAGYDVTAQLELAEGAIPLADISARYADSGEARIDVTSQDITFTPDGLQPAGISPLLDGLEDVRGDLNATAAFAWPRDLNHEQGRLALNDISFAGTAQVNDLDLSLTLDRLLPPASPAGQRLTVARLEAGVPVEDIEVDFSLDSRPQLNIEDGGFDLGGARWFIEPVVLDPAAPEHRIVLGTEALDLAAFFRLIEVEGLNGSGTLKGKVPIIFSGGDVIVDNGRFEAQGPGHLSIRFEALRSALAGGGETVELAAQALEDFQYDNLSLTLDKAADNNATLRLSTLGHNPAVLEGQPFQFNINLESNLTSVLEALRQGYSLSDDALRRAWELQE